MDGFTCIAEEIVDVWQPLLAVGNKSRQRLRITQIGRKPQRLASPLPRLLAQRSQYLLTACDEIDLGTSLNELFGQREADATGGSGDYDPSVGKALPMSRNMPT